MCKVWNGTFEWLPPTCHEMLSFVSSLQQSDFIEKKGKEQVGSWLTCSRVMNWSWQDPLALPGWVAVQFSSSNWAQGQVPPKSINFHPQLKAELPHAETVAQNRGLLDPQWFLVFIFSATAASWVCFSGTRKKTQSFVHAHATRAFYHGICYFSLCRDKSHLGKVGFILTHSLLWTGES